METYGLIIDMVVIALGIYCLYLWYKQSQGTFVENNKLLLHGATSKNCQDIDTYMKEINPYLIITGIISVLYGAFDMGIERYGFLTPSIQMIFIVIYVISLFILITKIQNINRKYWPNLK